MCSIIAHDKKHPSWKYKEIIIGDRPIPKNATTKELEPLGVTLYSIDCWLKLCDQNYEVICGMNNKAMKLLLKIPTIKSKSLSLDKNSRNYR